MDGGGNRQHSQGRFRREADWLAESAEPCVQQLAAIERPVQAAATLSKSKMASAEATSQARRFAASRR